MTVRFAGLNWWKTLIALTLTLSPLAALANSPKTPQEFADQYMAAFKSKDMAAVKKLRYPTVGKSQMMDFLDAMIQADMQSGAQYDNFELLPVQEKMNSAQMGPDGVSYKPNLKPTNVLKLSSKTSSGSSSTSFPIGVKDGIYYAVCPVPDTSSTPDYKFGWQRFNPPKTTWSVMLPNEPEPGKAALEKQFGPSALEDPDVYGVVKNTADIKTFQHIFQCGAEGKRLRADDNKETFRASCITYTPETLKNWFSDPQKTLDDMVNARKMELSGKLEKQSTIDLGGAPGREFEVRGDDGTLCLGRVYWIKDSLYQLVYETQDPHPDLKGAQKFLSSLQVN
jgi:hypothetical protein